MNFLNNHFKNLLYSWNFNKICEKFRTCSGYIPPSIECTYLNFYLNIRWKMEYQWITQFHGHRSGVFGLTPKCHPGHFVAYEWQWKEGSRGRWFFIHWFFGQLVRPFMHHIQLKNHHGRFSSFCKNEFCKKNGWPCSVFFKISLYC
jgi:hypothetical protein